MDQAQVQSWSSWLQDIAKTGLTAKWDGEYLDKFRTANQVPVGAPANAGTAPAVPLVGGVVISAPTLLLGLAGLLVVGGVVYLATK